jgi:hypothetical protein
MLEDRPAPEPPKEPGSGSQSPTPLFFDPNAFPAAVADVARAYDSMELIAEQVPTTSEGDPSEFGAVFAAWLAFQRAWSAEVATAQSALKEMVDILPVVGKAYLDADQAHGSSP